MAAPSTVNTWLDHLSSSILQKKHTSKQDTKRLQETFRRHVRKHNFARTNQFEVTDRLNGLEEKFQILTLDNLSDALRQRRDELKHFQNHWLPDVLDLFLHLAGDPARNEKLLELYRIPPRIGTPPPLRWKDLLAESPINKHDRLWRVPDFRDADGSDHDHDLGVSVSVLTPSPKRGRPQRDENLTIEERKLFQVRDETAALSPHSFAVGLEQPRHVSEERLIREVLFLLRGYASSLFENKQGRYQLHSAVEIRGISSQALRSVMQQISLIRQDLDTVRAWLNTASALPYMAAMQNEAEHAVVSYYTIIDDIQQDCADPDSTAIVSLVDVLPRLGQNSTELSAIASFLNQCGERDMVGRLETLYSVVQEAQLCADIDHYRCLSSMLVSSLVSYLQPVWHWLVHGKVTGTTSSIFIRQASTCPARTEIWHGQFLLETGGPDRYPAFLASTIHQVFACGKTSAFLCSLGEDLTQPLDAEGELYARLRTLQESMDVPLVPTFENAWHEHVTALLDTRTTRLKAVLRDHCGFRKTLEALSQIYLHQEAPLLDNIELKLFDRIDHCMEGWNDKFQLKDMIEEAFAASGASHIADSLTIHSSYTSSRSMQSRRTSVKILSSLAIDYNLSWPLANIIDAAAMISYRRVALVLMQIRRSKYCLERTGYLSSMTVPLSEDATSFDQKLAQTFAFTLLNFVNTLFDHLLTTIIWPLTNVMHEDMDKAITIDAMIDIHGRYITRLECSCLAAPKLKTLRESLIAILDLSIRFSDLVSNTAKAGEVSSDHETSSFTSALSRRKFLRADQCGSDSDSDELGHPEGGYSSFIVLSDDTTIVKELQKVQAQYTRHIKLFTAALRGVGKAGQHVHDLEGLADRLS